MRPGLLPGLLTALKRNRNRGFADAALFELGQAYRGEKRGRSVHLGRRRARRNRQARRQRPPLGRRGQGRRPVRRQGRRGRRAGRARLRSGQGADHPRRAGLVSPGPLRHAAARAEDRARALRRDASGDAEGARRRGPVAAFEVFLDALPAQKAKSRAKPRLEAADLLPVRRDFAFVLDRECRPATWCAPRPAPTRR